jgi:Trypsin-like peptidase domain
MSFENIPTSFQSLPVLISGDTGSAGSGFFLTIEESLYLVTARHVILDNACEPTAKKLRLSFWLWNKGIVGGRTEYALNLDEAMSKNDLFCGQDSDVAAVRVANIKSVESDIRPIELLNGFAPLIQAEGQIFNYSKTATKPFNEVAVGNEAFTIGYPLSLSAKPDSQLDVSRPLLRRGLVAAKYEDRHHIVLDCPVYKGNSGGPVIEIYRCGDHCYKNHFKIIGVVSSFVPLVQTWSDDYFGLTRTELFNSGYSIITPLDTVFKLIESKAVPSIASPEARA